MAFAVEDIAAAIASLGIFDPGDGAALAAYLFPQYAGQRDDLVKAHYDTLIAQITGQVSQDILDRASNLAETAADSLLATMSAADLNTIGEKIAAGMEAGLNPRDIARNLQEVQGLDSNRAAQFEKFKAGLEASDMTDAQIAAAEEREFQRLLAERRHTIARTEASKAVNEGDFLAAKNDGGKYKYWQTTGDERVSDECQGNEAEGPIPIDQEFSGGVQTAPQHPGCRCSVSFIDDPSALDLFKDITDRGAERTATAKEKAKNG